VADRPLFGSTSTFPILQIPIKTMNPQIMQIIFIILTGAIYGSFLTAAIPRVIEKKTLNGRSHCDSCQKKLGFFELFPILSFIYNRGRCRGCKKSIGWRNLLIELAMIAWASSLLFIFPDEPIKQITLLLLGGILLAIAVSDLFWGVIPSDWLIVGTIVQLVYLIPILIQRPDHLPAVIAAIVLGAGWFAVQHFVSQGRWVGDGDIWLGGLLGLIHFSLWPILVNLGVAYISGAVVAVFLVMKDKKNLKASIPFGPFLVLGAFVVWLVGA
jgi:prepilin signal peptidase PulO-like enzyme (type II secretory pathway)